VSRIFFTSATALVSSYSTCPISYYSIPLRLSKRSLQDIAFATNKTNCFDWGSIPSSSFSPTPTKISSHSAFLLSQSSFYFRLISSLLKDLSMTASALSTPLCTFCNFYLWSDFDGATSFKEVLAFATFCRRSSCCWIILSIAAFESSAIFLI
jgi:hypothetical protein